MLRSRMVAAIGALLLAASLAVGLWPVSTSENVGFARPHSMDNMPDITAVTVRCGSPLLKAHPVYEGVHSADPDNVAHDPCALIRDHRRGPVELLGASGVLTFGVAAGVYLVRRRRSSEGR